MGTSTVWVSTSGAHGQVPTAIGMVAGGGGAPTIATTTEHAQHGRAGAAHGTVHRGAEAYVGLLLQR